MNQRLSDPLAFEVVDIQDARKSLDRGLDGRPLAGAQQASATLERPTLAKPAEHQEQLPSTTVRWIVGLPAAYRPLHLFKYYPKIGNALALIWNDPKATQEFFDGLMVDHRGGRQGFPKEVFDDLMRLQDLLNEKKRG